MYEWHQSIQTMINWLEEHVTENPTLLDMSKQIGYSPYYCSTQFHKIVGITIRSYLAQRKLYHATIEIRDTKNRILEIAIKYGYSSQEALTRAFSLAYGCTPSAYRKYPRPVCLPVKQSVLRPEFYIEIGESFMTTTPNIKMEYIPAHKYIGVYKQSKTSNGDIWAAHDCDLLTGIVQSMCKMSDCIVSAHTAGWVWNNGQKSYFYGLGVPLDYSGEIPEGFEIKEIPASYYIVFSHPPFEYPKENSEAMDKVEDLAWDFDPKTMGYVWNEDACQDYQRHYPEVIGYQVLRPVKKA